MADTIDRTRRSANMRAIRSVGMKPELAVRRLVHGLGYRYRLHRADLAGKPDLVFVARRKVVFVHGCFWHDHGCKLSHLPKSNRAYWEPKLKRNKARDETNLKALRAQGWKVFIVWECETKDVERLTRNLERFLSDHRSRRSILPNETRSSAAR